MGASRPRTGALTDQRIREEDQPDEHKNPVVARETASSELASPTTYCTCSHYQLDSPPHEDWPLPEPDWGLDADGYPLPETLLPPAPKKKQPKRRRRKKKTQKPPPSVPLDDPQHRTLHYIFCHDPDCPFHR
jgi:hypothetical protein